MGPSNLLALPTSQAHATIATTSWLLMPLICCRSHRAFVKGNSLQNTRTSPMSSAPIQRTADTSSQVYRKIALRLIPVLMFLYLVGFLDRVNTSFAALTMNRDLRISNTAYGVGAGIFFLGYFLFEVPSNLALARVGARRWIALLMIVWGTISVCLGFVRTPTTYILARFLLGAAEAGFFPGVVLYLTGWFPASARGGYMAAFLLAIPLSSVLGAPLSIAILRMEGTAHLHGWQWLFLLEGGLAVLVGLLVPLVLPNSPQQANWLDDSERTQLFYALAAEADAKPTTDSLFTLMRNPAVLTCSVAYFSLMTGLYAMSFWTPRILTSEGVPVDRVGWLTAAPYLLSAVPVIPWCRHSDHTGERRQHLTTSFLLACAGFIVVAISSRPAWSIAGLSLAAFGIFSGMSLFWTVATIRLGTGTAVIAGTALINSLGNFGGFVGPWWLGWLLDRTHSFAASLLSVGGVLGIGAAIAFGMTAARRDPNAGSKGLFEDRP